MAQHDAPERTTTPPAHCSFRAPSDSLATSASKLSCTTSNFPHIPPATVTLQQPTVTVQSAEPVAAASPPLSTQLTLFHSFFPLTLLQSTRAKMPCQAHTPPKPRLNLSRRIKWARRSPPAPQTPSPRCAAIFETRASSPSAPTACSPRLCHAHRTSSRVSRKKLVFHLPLALRHLPTAASPNTSFYVPCGSALALIARRATVPSRRCRRDARRTSGARRRVNIVSVGRGL